MPWTHFLAGPGGFSLPCGDFRSLRPPAPLTSFGGVMDLGKDLPKLWTCFLEKYVHDSISHRTSGHWHACPTPSVEALAEGLRLQAGGILWRGDRCLLEGHGPPYSFNWFFSKEHRATPTSKQLLPQHPKIPHPSEWPCGRDPDKVGSLRSG